jgi:hypothetical protein
VTGEWSKLHNEELNDLYSSPNIIQMIKSKRMGWAGHVACMQKNRRAHRVSVGTRGAKRLLAIPRRRWENNIQMYLQKIEGGPCTELIWIRTEISGGLL